MAVFEFTKRPENDEILVKLTDRDIANRVAGAVYDIIATRLADKFVQEHGERLMREILDDENLVEEVKKAIRIRLQDESESQLHQDID